MQKDFEAYYKALAVVEQIGQLGERDFLVLHQTVDNYFKAAPPSPPKNTERQSVQNEVKQLVDQINSLGKQQSDALATFEAMQKSLWVIGTVNTMSSLPKSSRQQVH